VVTAVACSGTTSPSTPAALGAATSKSGAEWNKAVLEGYCHTSAAQDVKDVQGILSAIDSTLPNIPPEESAYLKKESKDIDQAFSDESVTKSSHVRSDTRMTLLMNRRLYRVWLVRKDLPDAIDYVRGIYGWESLRKELLESPAKLPGYPVMPAFRRERADLLLRMISAIDQVSRVNVRLNELLTAEEYHTDHLLTDEQIGTLSATSSAMIAYLQFAMECELAHVVLDPTSEIPTH
jgi:hypothetical protein